MNRSDDLDFGLAPYPLWDLGIPRNLGTLERWNLNVRQPPTLKEINGWRLGLSLFLLAQEHIESPSSSIQPRG